MAWANKYRFRFNSVHGVEYNIYIQQEGYSGSVIQRHLGRSPILKRQKNGAICGTSLEFYAECLIDGEFTELYTSDPKEFKVVLYRRLDIIWVGFVSTELYSEPSIAPPYDVQIIATDGLGELKQVDYAANGEVTIPELLRDVLSYTGLSREILIAWEVKEYGQTPDAFISNTYVGIDYMEGKTMYDVLEYFLNSFNAIIMAYGSAWLIVRETDLDSSVAYLSAYDIPAVSGIIAPVLIPTVVKSLGKKGVADIWPVGYYSSSIEPARRQISVTSEWHTNNILTNPELMRIENPGWTFDTYSHLGFETYGRGPSPAEIGRPTISFGQIVDHQGYLCQMISLPSLKQAVKVSVYGYGTRYKHRYPSLSVVLKYVTNNTTYYGDADGWTEDDIERGRNPKGAGAEASWIDTEISNPDIDVPGTLYIYLYGNSIAAIRAKMEYIMPNKGYRDTLILDNGARGSNDDVECLHGHIFSGEVEYAAALSGVFKKITSGTTKTIITSFADRHSSDIDFMALTAMSYAMSVALPRLKIKGVLDIPSIIDDLPLFLSAGQVRYSVETFSWDLYDEECDFEAISLPAASLTIESESFTLLDNAPSTATESSGGSSSGGSGGSSAGGSGLSMLQVWRELTNNSSLDSYGANTQIAAAHVPSFFEVDANGNLKLKNTYGGLYTEGFITAGTAAASSDQRLKDGVKDIEPENALKILLSLRPREWVWNKKNGASSGRRGAGLVAQEAMGVLPFAVLENGEYLALNYNILHAYEIAVIQFYERRIMDLEGRMRKLENMIGKE